MTDNLNTNENLIPYKEMAQKRALESYHANKTAISQKRKEQYKQLSPEDKKKLLEYDRQWLNNQTPKRQLKLRKKAQEYNKTRYDNVIVKVH